MRYYGAERCTRRESDGAGLLAGACWHCCVAVPESHPSRLLELLVRQPAPEALDGGQIKPLTSGNPPQLLKEVGFGTIQWHASRSEVPWLASIPQQQVVLHWHGDRCCLPKKAKILASSPHCQEQAFQLGASAVGLQFHIEVTKPNLERWVTEDQEFILAAGLKPHQINDEALEWDSELSSKGRFLLDALLDHLLSQV